ncbi:MAG: gamma-glutamyl-gamma-aminobutyrate hydrolase family protein [Desulfovibrio sp.]
MTCVESVRIGVTMRVVQASGYVEHRDALARDWTLFMRQALPEAVWMPLPNAGRDVLRLVEAFGLTGIIFSGGNDLGDAPERDETEQTLLRHCLDRDLPCLGVCRGLQLFQAHFGGKVSPCPDGHVPARDHAVSVDALPGLPEPPAAVNSFHALGVTVADLAEGLVPFARTPDGLVEGLVVPGKKAMAVQWHPERESPLTNFSRALVRSVFLEDHASA